MTDEKTEQPKLVIRPTVFSRIVGYITPLDSWNVGKQQEFKDRVTYSPIEPQEVKDETGQ